MADLQITTPENVTWDFPIEGDEVVIGRSTRMVEDLESRNGTFVGQRRIEAPIPIEDEEILTLGGSRVVFRVAEEPPADPEWDPMSGHTVFCSADALLESGSFRKPSDDSERAKAASSDEAVERLRLLNDVRLPTRRSKG